ncbi:MAG TPA: FAD-dependent oxidoreductase [Acidimicrobiales bacterium]
MPARQFSAPTEHHQCIVTGAGVLGLAAAWSLSRRGLEVLVVDRHAPGHARSGSKGSARIFRLSYPDPFYVEMAADAATRWRALETDSGRPLLHQRGQVNFGRSLPELADAMTRAGASFDRLSAEAGKERFPNLNIDGPSLFEAGAGVLVADRCLQALCDTGSFEVRAGAGVRLVRDDGDLVTIILETGESLSADIAVNCAGQNATLLMDGLRAPVAALPSRQQVVYLEPARADPVIPSFIEWADDMIYGLPLIGQDRLKLSHHTPGPTVIADDDLLEDDAIGVDRLLQAAKRLLPTFAPQPVATECCVYDNTVDTDFIIDRVGRVVIGCGTSGHGFKFAPLLGELMADLATGIEPRFGLGRFASDRSVLRLLPKP